MILCIRTKSAVKAVELIGKFSKQDKPFFLGSVLCPHVPFVAPKKYYEPFCYTPK